MGYFDRVDDRVTVSLHILYTANQETEGSQNRLTVYNQAKAPFLHKSAGLSIDLIFFMLITIVSVAVSASRQ